MALSRCFRDRPVRAGATVGFAAVALGAVGLLPAQALTSPGLVTTTPDSTVATADGRVSALLQVGNTLYVGGQFNNVGGAPHVGLAALDATTGQVLPFTADVSGIAPGTTDSGVTSLAVTPDGRYLIVGGTFSRVQGQSRTNLAEIDLTTRVVTAWSPVPNGGVLALAAVGSQVLVGGKFGAINGQHLGPLVEVDATTGAPNTSFKPVVGPVTPVSPVRALNVLPGGASVLIGGDFTTVGGLSRPHLASISTASGAVTAWRPLANSCPVNSIATDARLIRVFVACGGGTIGGNRLDAFYLNTGGSAWPQLGGATAPSVSDGNYASVAVLGDTVYGGGHFDNVNGSPQRKLAAFDAYTGSQLSWNAGFDSALGVFAVLTTPGHLWAGGDFTAPAAHLARFTVATSPAPSAPVPAVVAVQGTNKAAYVWSSVTNSWTNYGGRVAGPPAILGTPGGHFYLVASNETGTLYSRTDRTGWSAAAGSGSVCYDPGLTYADANSTTLLVACMGSTKAVYVSRWATTPGANPYFSSFSSLGGVVTAGPAAYVNPATSMPVYDAVGKTFDTTLADLYTRTDPSPWTAMNIRCASHPAAGTATGNDVYTACRDSLDNTLHLTIGGTGAPNGGFDGSLGGAAVGGVGLAVAPDDTATSIFVQGTNGQLYRNTAGNDGTASGWASLGGALVGGVRATPLLP